MKILLVEDEKHMAEAVAQVLKKNNFAIDLSYDGEDGLDQALTGIYDIIILDIMLPGMDGISVLEELRKEGVDTPVMLLTAKSGTQDKVAGLDSGADDYLAKPFPMEELLARLRALSRRKGELIPDGVLQFGDIALDPLGLTLRHEDETLQLTQKECQLLELLMGRRGGIVAKESIIEKLWGYEGEAEDNHAEAYISFLRKKLKAIGAQVRIQTRRGAGYLLTMPEDKHV